MLYYRCPTCGTILANKQILYETKLAAICAENPSKEQDKKKEKILDELEIKMICCRMRALTYLNEISLII